MLDLQRTWKDKYYRWSYSNSMKLKNEISSLIKIFTKNKGL